ncbi:MAG: putative beta-barrel porin-2, OmpL-like, partial [Bacteroidota bacterium]
PYYISGFRYKYTLSKQWQAQLFLMNGWQHLLAEGNRLSYGSLLSSKKNKWNFNWSQYMGNMAPIGKVNGSIAVQKWRFLEEFNLGYTTNTWAFQSCVYVGMQRVLTSSNYWAQGNVQVEKTLRQNWHFNARAEVFRDPNKVMMSGADSPKSSFSVGWRKDIGSVLQCGQEARIFIGNSTQLPVFYQFLRLKFS